LDNYTTNELIGLLKQRNLKGYHSLYKQYAAVICGAINVIVKNKHDTERLLQQTLTDICSKINQYEPLKSSFLIWILQVARCVGINYIRSTKEQIDPEYPIEADLPLAIVELILIPDINIKPGGPDIFTMILQGCKVDDIAEQLNISVETAKMNVRKAMQLKFKSY